MNKATMKLSLAVALLISISPECFAFVARIRSPTVPFANIRLKSNSRSVSSVKIAALRKVPEKRMSKSNNNNYGQDMDQEAMMESDMLVAVDQDDILIDTGSSTSKKLAHTFNSEQPRGVLHRAFSFFLFDQDNKMLLTQRASSKITFPSVWTNTCCSHPLYGMTPDEVDPVPAAYPKFPGIKHAAIRKCQHELGIAPENIEHDKITFISRFQYWAADTVTYGKEAPWGEHEVDYILFYKLPPGMDLPIDACEDEVEDYKYVSIDELKDMMKEPDLLWSPWFLGIMERGGFQWWEDMDRSLAGANTNDRVEFFDPPPAHVAAYNKDTHRRETGILSGSGILQI